MINDDIKHVEYIMNSLDKKEALISDLQVMLSDSEDHIKSLFLSNTQLRQQIAELQSKNKIK